MTFQKNGELKDRWGIKDRHVTETGGGALKRSVPGAEKPARKKRARKFKERTGILLETGERGQDVFRCVSMKGESLVRRGDRCCRQAGT